jgi:hypothetical protein
MILILIINWNLKIHNLNNKIIKISFLLGEAQLIVLMILIINISKSINLIKKKKIIRIKTQIN